MKPEAPSCPQEISFARHIALAYEIFNPNGFNILVDLTFIRLDALSSNLFGSVPWSACDSLCPHVW